MVKIDIENNLVKIGKKERHLKVPDGYCIIAQGFIRDDDLILELSLRGPIGHWVSPEDHEVGHEIWNCHCVVRKAK